MVGEAITFKLSKGSEINGSIAHHTLIRFYQYRCQRGGGISASVHPDRYRALAYEQTGIVADFSALINATTVNFRCIRGGVANLADTPTNFLTANFLTWQPIQKKVTYYLSS